MVGAGPGAAARQRAGGRRGGSLAARRAARRRLPSARPQQSDYAAAVTPAFAPRDQPDQPRAVLAEAGTGVGKTLGYIAAASLWAEKNRGSVWISTYTRNLQTQIAGELDRLYPDPERQTPQRRDPQGTREFSLPAELRGRARRRDGPAGKAGRASRADRPLDRCDARPATSWPAISRAGSPNSSDAAGSVGWPIAAASAYTRPARIFAAVSSKRTSARRGRRASSSPTTRWSWRRPRSAGSTMRPFRPAMSSTRATICWMPPTAPFRCACRARKGVNCGAGSSAPKPAGARAPEACGAGSAISSKAMTTGAKALLEVLAAARVLPGNGWAQRVAEARGHQGFERFLVLVRAAGAGARRAGR